ncbi:ribose ABC transporter permease [Actinocatenispora thailandica]|uniref:Autoinducer 2 import system permease protein LsrD n=1 Tax=Actinocatenispora thailandica TaxID=227318 RepID=A0A7R7HZV3_9ACTN|nr:ABC transporter permease [Actinocatenispora thailandica]BCJ37774.1 ribose ABC transporter permease [Actinocatenispora thailandica]
MTATQPSSAADQEPATASRGAEPAAAHRSVLSRALLRQELTLVLVIIAIGAAAFTRNPEFLSGHNVLELFRSSVIYFVMACGAAMLSIGGGLDFSVGGVFTLGALSTSLLLVRDVPWPLAVLFGVAVGALVGIVNHLIITYWHVPPIIATLGTFFVLLGVNAEVSQGDDVLPLPDSFTKLGQGNVLGVPNVVLYAVVVGVVCWFVLERTRFGVNVRALGGNRQAAVQNGLRVVRLNLALYAIAGATGSLAGIIYTARVGAGQVQAGGATTTLNVVTAVLIGGVSLFGGLGTITGVAFGALLLSTVDNALIVAQVPPAYNNIIVGAILIGAVGIDHLRRKRLYRRG